MIVKSNHAQQFSFVVRIDHREASESRLDHSVDYGAQRLVGVRHRGCLQRKSGDPFNQGRLYAGLSGCYFRAAAPRTNHRVTNQGKSALLLFYRKNRGIGAVGYAPETGCPQPRPV